MKTSKGISSDVQQRATTLLVAYIAGEVHARTLHSGFLALNVGIRHRVVCKKTAKHHHETAWELIPHEEYNRHIGHRKYRGTAH